MGNDLLTFSEFERKTIAARVVVHAPDKSSGHRTQEVEIHFRFRATTAIAMADSMVYDKKRKAA